jgi:hypothetical protein
MMLLIPLEFNSIVAVNTNCDENDIPDHIHLDWTNTVPGISEYQLEWLYINNYGDDPNTAQNTAETTLVFNFKLNSTRITTTNEEYDLSLVFDQGWILFRLRGVGINSNGETIYGDWNVLDTGLVSDVTSNKFEVTSDMRHYKTLNWQYSATYAEEGKKKEIGIGIDSRTRSNGVVYRYDWSRVHHRGKHSTYAFIWPISIFDKMCPVFFPFIYTPFISFQFHSISNISFFLFLFFFCIKPRINVFLFLFIPFPFRNDLSFSS